MSALKMGRMSKCRKDKGFFSLFTNLSTKNGDKSDVQGKRDGISGYPVKMYPFPVCRQATCEGFPVEDDGLPVKQAMVAKG